MKTKPEKKVFCIFCFNNDLPWSRPPATFSAQASTVATHTSVRAPSRTSFARRRTRTATSWGSRTSSLTATSWGSRTSSLTATFIVRSLTSVVVRFRSLFVELSAIFGNSSGKSVSRNGTMLFEKFPLLAIQRLAHRCQFGKAKKNVSTLRK